MKSIFSVNPFGLFLLSLFSFSFAVAAPRGTSHLPATSGTPLEKIASRYTIRANIGLDASSGTVLTANGLGFGAGFSYKVNSDLSIGGTVNSADVQPAGFAPSANARLTILTFDGQLTPIKNYPDLYIGMSVGAGIFTPTRPVGSDFAFILGPVVGQDFWITRNFTVGPKASYLFVNRDNIRDFQLHLSGTYRFGQ